MISVSAARVCRPSIASSELFELNAQRQVAVVGGCDVLDVPSMSSSPPACAITMRSAGRF